MTKDLAPGAGSVARRTLLQGMAGAAALTLLPRQALAQAAKEAPDLARLVADGKLPKLADRLPDEADGGEAAGEDRDLWRHAAPRPARQRRPQRHPAHGRQSGTGALESRLHRGAAGRRRALGGERERDRIHLPSAQGHEVVGRQAVHRRRHRVLDRRLRQEHRAVQVAAFRDRDRRQGLQRREDQRDDRQVHLRELVRAVPGADGDAARPVSDAVRQALLRAVPSRSTIRTSPTW